MDGIFAGWIDLSASILGILGAIAGTITYLRSQRFRDAVQGRASRLLGIARQLGDDLSYPAVIYAAIAYVLAFAAAAILPSDWLSANISPPWAGVLDGLFYAALLIAIFGSIRHAKIRMRLDRQKVQVIAWEGWEEPNLYPSSPRGGFARDYLEFLLYVRGLGTVPVLLTANRRGYDVIVSDAEFIPSYRRKNRLRPLDGADLKDSWDSVSATILKLFEPLIAPSKQRTAIPCRFGFQEILARSDLIAKMAKAGMDTNCIKSFAPDKLLNKFEDIRIGIWDWYLPAISIILHTQDNVTEPIAKIRTIHRQRVEDCLQTIQTREFKERISLLEHLPDIADRLLRAEIDIVYGAGSWALKKPDDRIEIVRPKEGIFIWAECAGILSDSDTAERSFMVGLINHWLLEATQMKLGRGNALRALPTNIEALRAVANCGPNATNAIHPACGTLEWLCDLNDDVLRPDRIVTPRRLPISNAGDEDIAALEWELAWSDFQKWCRSH